MPRIKDIFLNDPVYPNSSYIGSWENLSSSKYYTISAFCSSDCEVKIDNSFDSVQIVKTTTTPLVGGNLIEITSPISTSFIRVSIINIIPPSDLKIEAFFFTD